MAERGTNFYYPPDFDPKKHGSANGYQGVHHLRERARKIGEGIIIIRFEMPYNIWCEGCNNHIGMGVRYNAQKSKTGKYYSTTIYKFRMKCHLCDNHFEMETDPQNMDYKILCGARRQERRWDPTKNEQIAPEDSEEVKKLAQDKMYLLEHEAVDRQKLEQSLPVLERITIMNERMKDDYTSNQSLRRLFRSKKKELKAQQEKDEDLLSKSSLSLTLLPESERDTKVAKLLKLHASQSSDERRRQVRSELLSQSLFEKPSDILMSPQSAGEQKRKIAQAVARRSASLTREKIKNSVSGTLGTVSVVKKSCK